MFMFLENCVDRFCINPGRKSPVITFHVIYSLRSMLCQTWTLKSPEIHSICAIRTEHTVDLDELAR